MSRTRRRVLLYGFGVAIAAAGLWAKHGYHVAPDPGVRLNGAALVAGLGQYEEALRICALVLEEHPDNLEARIYRATFLTAAGRKEEGLVAYDDALRHVENAQMRRNLETDRAAVLLSLGRVDEFRRAREKLASAGEDSSVHALDGLEATSRGDHAAAAAAYAAAVESRPGDDRLKARLWNALMAQGEEALAARRFDEARRAFDAACPLFEAATNAHLKAAEVRLATDDAAGAVRVLRDLAPGTPGAAPLLVRCATALLRAADEKAALDALQAAVRVDARQARVLVGQEEAWKDRLADPRIVSILETGAESERENTEPR